jgi:hypothetical protein
MRLQAEKHLVWFALMLGVSTTAPAQTESADAERSFTAPVLGASGKATVLSPDRRSTAAELDQSEYRVLIPGCEPSGAGVFVCDSISEYQHCRTLMIGRLVYSCEADIAFDAGFAESRPARADEYSLEVESDARIRVTLGDRGNGQIKGDAEVEIAMHVPTGEAGWCLQQDRLVYHPTGPRGGSSDIGEPDDCGEPIEVAFEPHQDDLLRAYDQCESFAAWGMNIEDSFGLVVAGVFHIRSASPDFVARYGSGTAVIAAHIEVAAPLSIDCRN